MPQAAVKVALREISWGAEMIYEWQDRPYPFHRHTGPDRRKANRPQLSASCVNVVTSSSRLGAMRASSATSHPKAACARSSCPS